VKEATELTTKLPREPEATRRLYPEHFPSILHGALGGAGSLWPSFSCIKKGYCGIPCPKQFVQLVIIPGGYIEAQLTLAISFYILAPKLVALLLDYNVKEVALLYYEPQNKLNPKQTKIQHNYPKLGGQTVNLLDVYKN
jgi:hypothetical protein